MTNSFSMDLSIIIETMYVLSPTLPAFQCCTLVSVTVFLCRYTNICEGCLLAVHVCTTKL